MLLNFGAAQKKNHDRGQTPLGGVAFKGYPGIAELLIEYGADVHANNGGGMRPLHYAVMFGRFDVAEVLKKHGAETKPANQKKGKREWLPLLARWIGTIRSLFR